MATATKVLAILELDLREITVVPGHNARKQIGDLTELKASMNAIGLLQPITVAHNGGNYQLVAGERRLAAARELGWTSITAVVREFGTGSAGDAERSIAMVVENLQRVDLSPLEEADGYKRLAALGLSQGDIAAKVGRSQAHISKRVSLLQLPAKIQEKVDSGGIAVGDALELAKLVEHPEALKRIRIGDGYQTVAAQVRAELADIKAVKAREDALRGLKERGVKIIETKGGFYGFYSVKDRPLKGQGNRYDRDGDSINVTLKKHEGEPCHAARVMQTGEVIYVCTNPTRHVKDDPKAAKEAAKRADELAGQKAERKLKTEATSKRLEVMRQLVEDGEAYIQFAVKQLAAASRSEEGRVAVEILDLLAAPQKYGRPAYDDALVAHASKSKKRAGDVLLALAFASIEPELRNGWGGRRAAAAHIALLKSAGYVPNASDERAGLPDADDTCKGCGGSIDDALGIDAPDEEVEAYETSKAEVCFRCWREKPGAWLDGVIPDSPEPVIEDYPAEEREKILLDTANSVLDGIEHVADPKEKRKRIQTAVDLIAESELENQLARESGEVIVKADDEHSGGWTATINGQGAESTQTAEVPSDDASDGGSVAPALPDGTDGQPVSQHVCRSCGTREGPWAEMVDVGWLCVNCDAAAPVAAVVEKAGPVDQRARTRV